MRDWIWIRAEVVAAVHDRQLAEHGGPPGTRDAGGLEAALARPRNVAVYAEPDAAALAAAYAFGIARNHPFVDGNKRTAWILARLFLRDNGVLLQFGKQEAIRTVESLAAGELGENDLAEWLCERVRPA